LTKTLDPRGSKVWGWRDAKAGRRIEKKENIKPSAKKTSGEDFRGEVKKRKSPSLGRQSTPTKGHPTTPKAKSRASPPKF